MVQRVQDTSPEAMAVQASVHRNLGGPRKVLIACEMSDSVRAMAQARIKAQHPDFDDTAVLDELIWELYGVRRQR
jgi:glycine/serine hydroxymethyltransferase